MRPTDRVFPRALLRSSALALILLIVSCAATQSDVVAGSAHIAAILRELAPDKAPFHNLIPPAACPGHCDMRPSDVEAVATCTALLIHPWQREMANVSGVIESSGIEKDRIHVIDVPGNWMVPAVQAAAVKAVSEALSQVDPDNAAVCRKRASERVKAVQAYGDELSKELADANVASVKVFCNEKLTGFVKWAGFDVAGTFGRPEDLSVADVEDHIRTAREKGVVLVVDNLQSGETKTSEAIARDIGAGRVVLTNFPGGFEGTDTWEKAIRKNVDLLLEAAKKAEQGHE